MLYTTEGLCLLPVLCVADYELVPSKVDIVKGSEGKMLCSFFIVLCVLFLE